MVKKIGLTMVLLAVGVAIAMYIRGGSAPEEVTQVFAPRTNASDSERIADLERTLAAQVDRANLMASRLAALEARGGARDGVGNADGADPRAERGAAMRGRGPDVDGNFDPATMRQRMRDSQLDRLVEAGFTRERAEWIERRVQELQLQAQQAQFEAQRNGEPFRGVDTFCTGTHTTARWKGVPRPTSRSTTSRCR
jgi:hypothetical protein